MEFKVTSSPVGPAQSPLPNAPPRSPSPGAARAPESITAQALAELQEYENGALLETEENMSFAMGGRLREARRAPAGPEGGRARVLMHKLVAEVAAVEGAQLDGLLEGANDWMHSPDMLAALLAQTPDPGQAALYLAAWLGRGRPEPRLRSRLEEALAALTDDDMLALSLFGALEFGRPTPALRQQLVRLYHRASAQRQKLSQWFEALGERAGRARKLRAMMRVLAYELSASGQPIVGSHLAAVIGDLQQLLRLLGLEAHCDQTAQALSVPGLNGEALLGCVVRLAEQVWTNADSVAEALPPLEEEQLYRVVHALGRLVQLLPQDCFGDAETKTQLEASIAELRDRSVE
ncbi:HrpJ domain-containing protein [Pandoraea sputorum]|uniref:HrpJ domain-containing protein n=1 Tax=Pandoraea sputorum TaxID=93222 RepID=UPI001240FB36|nr:HrpJ domain-containing protein [Pandoraea sputorum]VVE55878.1 SepL/TyeA/HrpJ family type III secretion system gatekeeper [Pandoraea sputorum]